ncbi:MAG: hypothetical protein IJO52_12310, partial [Clostridia bacterium]|nr:hypothetical protein [Clostridia bacterium]
PKGAKIALETDMSSALFGYNAFNRWRGNHILSDVLRSGIIKEIWPQTTSVTCCYDWDDDKEEKYRMTKHLASLAGLGMSDEKTLKTNRAFLP